MKTFEVGKTYADSSMADHTLISRWTVVGRTAKTVTLRDRHGDEFRRGVREYEGQETCYPDGRYSMCHVLFAGKPEGDA